MRRAFGRELDDIEMSALERWEISPPERRWIGPARFLPDQLDRIRATAFGSKDTILRDFRGDFESSQEATIGFRLRQVDLIDGVLYAPHSSRHLRRRQHRMPFQFTPTEIVKGALYESWIGNRWFGNWLMNDCLTYRLAEQYGSPVTSGAQTKGHQAEYEQLLGMSPRRVGNVHFDELVLFRDSAHNGGSRERADDFRRRLVGPLDVTPHAGTYILRGSDGDKRLLRNERAIAEHLASTRGFRVLDPMRCSVEHIVATCAGARVIAGVEGSHLVHGLMVMPPEASLLVIQPPTRVVSVLKANTDRQGQTYAFVVGTGDESSFQVDIQDIDRTLDLLNP